MPFPVQQFFNVNGRPCGGCLVYTYASGTSVPLATYTDYTGNVQNQNPIVLNSAGYPSNGGSTVGIWLSSAGTYRIQLTDSFGSQMYLVDGVRGSGASSASQTVVNVPYSLSPVFTSTSQNTLFQMTLGGNVISSTLLIDNTIQAPAFITFELTQDNTGRRTFTWPPNVKGAYAIASGPNATTTQTFLWDGVSAFAVVPTATVLSVVPFSATPAFTAVSGRTMFQITLGGNVTSSTLTFNGVTPPAILTFDIIEDGTGGRTFTWPTNVLGGALLNTSAGANNLQTFIWDGVNAYAQSPNLANYTVGGPDFITDTLTAAGLYDVSTPIAGVGWIRMNSAHQICWRNNANSGNVCLAKNPGDTLVYPNGLSLGGGTTLQTTNQTGTGNLVMDTNPTISNAVMSGYGCSQLLQILANYTTVASDCNLRLDASGGSFTLTLNNTLMTNQIWYLNRRDSTQSNFINITTTSGQINGASSLKIPIQASWICNGGTNTFCTQSPNPNNPPLIQATILNGCGATCTFNFPQNYSATPACVVSGNNGTANTVPGSPTLSAVTVNTSVSTVYIACFGNP